MNRTPSLRGTGCAGPEAGERHDLEPLLAESRPITLGILDQGFGFRHPQGPAPALEPVVRSRPRLAGPCRRRCRRPVTSRGESGPRLPPVRFSREGVESLVHAPDAGEMVRARARVVWASCWWLPRTRSPPGSTLMEALGRDREAVAAALALPWSTGPVEGQIDRLKMLKRAMYGRADLDLLRARVLVA